MFNVNVCRIPDGSEAERHEQQDGHDTHGSLVARRVAALKNTKKKRGNLCCTFINTAHIIQYIQ